jgi:hypothetical protein
MRAQPWQRCARTWGAPSALRVQGLPRPRRHALALTPSRVHTPYDTPYLRRLLRWRAAARRGDHVDGAESERASAPRVRRSNRSPPRQAEWVSFLADTLRACWVMLRARWVTLISCWVTLRARWVTLRARWVTLRACWVALRARWVTLISRWVTLRCRWVTLRACWVTLRARWVTFRRRRRRRRAAADPRRAALTAAEAAAAAYAQVRGRSYFTLWCHPSQ